MSDQEDPMLKKIRALLALAERGTTEEERESANRKAEELIAKYGIDQALLANAGQSRDAVGDRVMVLPDPYARTKARLLAAIAQPLRVRVLFNTGLSRHIRGFQVHLFGFASDIQRVEILFTSLLVQAAVGMAAVRPTVGTDRWSRPTSTQVAAVRRDWLAGFGGKVRQRLEQAEARAVQQAESDGSTGTDLVLVDRNAAVDKAVERAYPKIGNDRPRAVRNEEAYRAGVRAGASADLGGTRIEGARRRAIST